MKRCLLSTNYNQRERAFDKRLSLGIRRRLKDFRYSARVRAAWQSSRADPQKKRPIWVAGVLAIDCFWPISACRDRLKPTQYR
jgi:hypothetical protein